MLGQRRETGRKGMTLLALAARWFRVRAGLRNDAGDGDHGHWDPVNRTWRYHTHRRELGRPGR